MPRIEHPAASEKLVTECNAAHRGVVSFLSKAENHGRGIERTTQQLVGRERNHVDSYRELACGVVDSRRVNSNVGRL